MRGRKPRRVVLHPEDVPVLDVLVRSGKTEQRVAKRADILLSLVAGKRIVPLTDRVGRDESTVWRVCRRYEKRGLAAVYDALRPGRLRRISPLGTGADRELGLHQAGRLWSELDPLVSADVAAGGDQAGDP